MHEYMDIKEFREEGYLQEANRQFFHPLGLALVLEIDDDGNWSLAGIWDERDDPEGWFFDWEDLEDCQQRAENVEKQYNKIAKVRRKLLKTRVDNGGGGMIQEIGFLPEELKEKDDTLSAKDKL